METISQSHENNTATLRPPHGLSPVNMKSSSPVNMKSPVDMKSSAVAAPPSMSTSEASNLCRPPPTFLPLASMAACLASFAASAASLSASALASFSRRACGRRPCPSRPADAAEADTPNFLKEIKFILGQRFCDPEELNGEKLRNTLSSSDITRCFRIDGIFAASDSDDGFREKRCVEIEELVEKIPKRDLASALKKWRAKEAADTEKEMTRLMRAAA